MRSRLVDGTAVRQVRSRPTTTTCFTRGSVRAGGDAGPFGSSAARGSGPSPRPDGERGSDQSGSAARTGARGMKYRAPRSRLGTSSFVNSQASFGSSSRPSTSK